MNLMRWLAAVALLTLACSAGAQLKPSTSKPPLTPPAATSEPKADAPAKAGSVEEAKEAAAQTAAEKWLALLDRGEFGKAWDECAQLFRERVTREQWVDGLPATRKPFGAMKSRRFEIAVYKTALAGAPDGEYVTARFITTFEKKEAEELLTLALENGVWRTTGYLIK